MGMVICYAIIYVIEALIAWQYSNYIFSVKRQTSAVILFYGIGHLILFALTQVWNDLIINSLSFFIVNALLLILCFTCSMWSAALHAALLSFIMGMTEVLTALILTPFTDYFGASITSLSALIALTVISKLLYYVLSIGLALFIKPNKNTFKDPITVLLLSALPFATLIVTVAFIYVGVTAPLLPVTEWLMVASMLSLLAVDLLVMVIYNNIRKITQENTLLQITAQKDKDDARLYQALQTQYDSQRVLIHDIRRHHEILGELLQQGRITEAIEHLLQLDRLPAIQNRIVFCKNSTLNIVLLQYNDLCKNSGVKLNADIGSNSVDFMDSISISALFGNLLSNAFEAAVVSRGKYIDLVIKPAGVNVVLITVDNACDTPPVVNRKGLFTTQKAQPETHGVGLSSVSQVVKKYDGELSMNYDEKEHAVRTIIQLQNLNI